MARHLLQPGDQLQLICLEPVGMANRLPHAAEDMGGDACRVWSTTFASLQRSFGHNRRRGEFSRWFQAHADHLVSLDKKTYPVIFECRDQQDFGASMQGMPQALEVLYRAARNPGNGGEVILRPVEETARAPTLFRIQ